MALPVTMYRWDDPGAPQLSQTQGSAVDVIKKCLIDGYGTKEPAGWVIEEISSDNKNMIFSPKSRAWMYLIYDDGRNSYWGNRGAMVGAIDAYNSIEEPISSLNYSDWTSRPRNDPSYYNQVIDKIASKWVILADEESFYLLLNDIGSAGVSAGCFFGKLDGNGHDLAYSVIANYGYYNDYDTCQLFSSYTSHKSILQSTSAYPILVDVNTGTLGSIGEAGPVNGTVASVINIEPSGISLDGVWSPIYFKNKLLKISAFLPRAEMALSPPHTKPEQFEVIDDYLYFNHVRFYLGE